MIDINKFFQLAEALFSLRCRFIVTPHLKSGVNLQENLNTYLLITKYSFHYQKVNIEY